MQYAMLSLSAQSSAYELLQYFIRCAQRTMLNDENKICNHIRIGIFANSERSKWKKKQKKNFYGKMATRNRVRIYYEAHLLADAEH